MRDLGVGSANCEEVCLMECELIYGLSILPGGYSGLHFTQIVESTTRILTSLASDWVLRLLEVKECWAGSSGLRLVS